MTDPTLASLPILLLKGIFTEFLKLWWFWLLILIIGIIATVIQKKRKNNKYLVINEIHGNRKQLNKLRNLKPSEFEEYIAHLFSKLGFTTEKVGGAYDGGIDVIAIKNNKKYYIQCKKFITSQVSVGSVRSFYGALVDHMANGKGYFITTNKFTLEAEKFAEGKPIELIDGQQLLKYIKMARLDNKSYFSKEEEKCPDCGGDLIEKNGKYGKFLGCSNYPKCRFTKNLTK